MADAVARVLASKNHYACLGLARDASERDLKLAYRSLSLALHPDKCTHPDAVTAFKRVSEAHAALTDPIKRRVYDHEQQQADQMSSLAARVSAGGAESGAGPMSCRASTHAPAPWQQPITAPLKPVWESAEDKLVRQRMHFEREQRMLEHDLAQLRKELHEERAQEKAREKRREAELTVQKRLVGEARAERDRAKALGEERLSDARRLHARERSEDAARVRDLTDELESARAEVELLMRVLGAAKAEVLRCGGAEIAASVAAAAAAEAAAAAAEPLPAEVAASVAAAAAPRPRRTTRSVEKDSNGNFVVVERDAVGGYAVSPSAASSSRPPAATVGPAPCATAAAASSSSAGGPPRRASKLSDALASLLRRAGLEHLSSRLEAEELYDLPLLRSFGPNFEANMREIGLDAPSIAKLQSALGLASQSSADVHDVDDLNMF